MLIAPLNLAKICFKQNYVTKPSFLSGTKKADSVELSSLKKEEVPTKLKKAKELKKAMEVKTGVMDSACIESIVNKVANETNLPKEQVQQAFLRLNQFSSYSQLKAMNKELNKNNISTILSSQKKT